MIDIFILILAIALIIIGILGCVLPIIPGPPISFLGLLVVHFTRFADFSTNFLWIAAAASLIVTALDFVVPIWGTRRYGGTKFGIWGASIGMVIGMVFLGPLGIILGPFLGAILGETLQGKKSNDAFRAGLGSFLGFLLGVGLKLATSFIFTFYFIREIVQTIRM
ncbi:MAG: DUF456 domain-containing protein [Bacteroidota bacterium]